MLYVEHFATNPELRGQGIGSDALNMLMELADKPVVLEVEPEDSNPLASRRIGFYRRHGFMLHSDYKYIQPPYTPESQSIEMKLMSSATIDPRPRTDIALQACVPCRMNLFINPIIITFASYLYYNEKVNLQVYNHIVADSGGIGSVPAVMHISLHIQAHHNREHPASKIHARKIVGDKWEIKCLLSNGANPESYDPSLTHLLNLENSKAYFRIGNVAFESAIINKVQNNNPV